MYLVRVLVLLLGVFLAIAGLASSPKLITSLDKISSSEHENAAGAKDSEITTKLRNEPSLQQGYAIGNFAASEEFTYFVKPADVHEHIPGTSTDRSERTATHSPEAKDDVLAIETGKLPARMLDYVRDHPYQTAFLVIDGITFIFPGLAWYKVLKLVGFGVNGPVAGTLATVVQSGIGNVAAGSTFSTLQRVGMTGGSSTLNSITRVAVGAKVAADIAQKEATNDNSQENMEEAKP